MLYIFFLISKITRNQMLISSNKVDDLSIIPNIYNNITHGCDDRFEINKKDIDPIVVQSILCNMKKKELLRFLTSDVVSINKKLGLVTKYEIIITSNISQMNFFSGGLMNDFNFDF